MNRRTAIKGLTAISTLSLLPAHLLFSKNKTTHFIGLGQGGTKALEYFFEKEQGKNKKFTSISDLELKKHKEINHIYFHSVNTDFRNRIYSTQNTKNEAELIISDEIYELFKEDHTYILLAGLGGYTGTNFLKKLSAFLYENKKDFMAIGSIPFKFEGENRENRVVKSLAELQSIPNFKYFYLETLRTQYRGMTVKEAFTHADKKFYKIYRNNS